MIKSILFTVAAIAAGTLQAQVTKLNSNKSLELVGRLTSDKAIYQSAIDSTLWVSNGTPAGTLQLSSVIKFNDDFGGNVLNGRLIFSGLTADKGGELYITDGTTAGTALVKDIYEGADSSLPADFATHNGWVYFTAKRPTEGRELWRTNGTGGGTELVKDIVPGAAGSNEAGDYDLYSNGSYMLFNAFAAGRGLELWKSDGTGNGTALLKDIRVGADSSDISGFFQFNNISFFTAEDATHGVELWKTDGTADGTVMVKDINPNGGSAILAPLLFILNNRVLFVASNGTNGNELWSTDGTEANTFMLKDINEGPGGSSPSLFSSVRVGDRLIFTASDASLNFSGIDIPTNPELWETDGTIAGTKLFKEIVAGPDGSYPFILSARDYAAGSFNTPLFQGNKFFLSVRTPQEGFELWMSDGTANGTQLVKNINPGSENGVGFSYIYTNSSFFFAGSNGTNGMEVWKSDGTANGTVIVADINQTEPEEGEEEGAGSDAGSFIIVNNKVIFQATDGDDADLTDLYALVGDFSLLPVKLAEFTVSPKNNDAMISWTTRTEVNVKNFTVERSEDGVKFTSIGVVKAVGSSTQANTYNLVDANIVNAGKEMVYYRLITTDYDGKTDVSKIIPLKLKGNKEFIVKLVTNPVQSEAIVMLSGITSMAKLSVKDFGGKTLYNSTVKANGQVNVPVANLAPGMYVLVAETENARQVIKFIKK